MGIHEQKIMQLMKAHNDNVCYIGEDFAEDFEDDDFLQGIQTIEIVGNELLAFDENNDMINTIPQDWEILYPLVKIYYGDK